MPIAFTIVFDIFPPEQRGKMTGLLGAVFGSSSVAGPLLGAYITDYISWHWIFYVNLPIGLISLMLILISYKESNEHSKQAIDWQGAITLVTAVISLMFALELGGKEYAWNSWPIIGLLGIFATFFLAFLYTETKAKEPIISFWMFKQRLFAASQITAFLYGATFVVLTVYIPIFVQSVYGGSATNAGLILTPMMLGSVAGSAVGGIFQTKTSYRNLMVISVVAYAGGMTLLSTMTPETVRWLVTIYMVIAGFGVGFSFSLLPIASVHNMDAKHRGSANSTNSFFRSLGMTIGITLFGTLQNRLFTDQLKSDFQGMQEGHSSSSSIELNNPQAIFEPSSRASIPDFILDKIVDAMSSSITQVFALALIPIALAAIAITYMGSTRVKLSKKPVVSHNE